MKIGLFGGSFNPPHYGHLHLASAFKREAQLDEVWILVSPEPPHKSGRILASYDHRLAMTSLLFQHSQGILVNRVEEHLPAPQYTYRTIEALKKEYPLDTFYLCLGEDSLEHFMEWRQPDTIMREVELLIARRPGVKAYKEDLPEHWLQRIHIIDAPMIPISSSDIRNRILTKQTLEALVPNVIAEYIKTHGLYASAAT